MSARLPVSKIIPGAFTFLWERKQRVIRALLIPVAILSLVELSPYYSEYLGFIKNLSPWLIVPFAICLWVAYIASSILFAITCHRLVLIGNTGVPEYGMLTWTRREWWFLAFVILLPLTYIIITLIILPLAGGLSKEFGLDGNIFQKTLFGEIDLNEILNHLLIIVGAYFFSRFSLLLPATAVDRDVDVPWAWKVSKGNGWRLTVVVGALPWTLSLLSDFFLREGATIAEGAIFVLTGLALLAFEIVALSLSYKYLSANEVVTIKEDSTA